MPTCQLFSTRGLHDPERIELWERHNAEALVALSCRSIAGPALEAEELNLALPHLQLAKVTANAHVVERSQQHIADSASDDVALYFSTRGDAFFYHPDGVRVTRPGTMLVCDLSRPFVRGFAHGLTEYVLTIPRPVFDEVAELDLHRQPIVREFGEVPGADPHAGALVDLLRRNLATVPTADPTPDPTADPATVEESVLELVRAILCEDGWHSAPARRRTAVSYIERHLSDPTLSVIRVAQHLGISERQLSRAFADGPGVAQTIQALRLERARRILSAPGSPAVGEVAMACGFVSHAHFSRVFRQHYGHSPAQLRGA